MLISLFLLHTVFLASHPLIVGLRSLHVVKKVQNSLLDSVGEGEGGMIWENGIEICIISYMKRVTSPGSMHDTGCLGLVHWDDKHNVLKMNSHLRKQQHKIVKILHFYFSSSFACL